MGASLCLWACGSEKKTDEVKDDKAAPEAAVDGDAAPKIVAVQADFDFGKVKQGVNVEHVFKIKNEGSADLKIEKARGS